MSTGIRTLVIAGLLVRALAVCAGPAAAQTRVSPGDRVRVESPQTRGVYTVETVSKDTLTLTRNNRAVDVALASVRKLEVSRGPKPRGESVGRGASYGFIAGAGTGIAVGFVAASHEPDALIGPTDVALALGLVLGVAGAVIGGLIGLAPGDVWQDVTRTHAPPVSPVGLSRDGGVRVAYTIRF